MAAKNNTIDNQRSKRRASTGERIFTRVHIFLYRLSGGAIGGRMWNSPILLLTTTGRKSGKQHTIPLLYLRDGDNLVIVASHGGAPTHPTWWLNLRSNPDTQVEIGKQRLHVSASEASTEERERLWPLLIEMYPSYADYQKRTERRIPVVILHPVETTRPE